MIPIPRTFNAADGLVRLDDLSGVIFSSESFAHRFEITRVDGYGFEGTISARFLRADGVTVYVEGDIERPFYDEVAVVELPPECYAVPGPFLVTIFDVIADVNQAVCIYAGRGTVLASESSQTTADAGTVQTIDAQIQAIMDRLSVTISTANLVALFARNIGDIENTVEGIQATMTGIDAALAEAGIMPLAQPNLLKYQPEGVTKPVPNGPIVVKYYTIPAEDATAAAEPITLTFTDAAIHAGMVLHYVMSRAYAVCTRDMVTAVVTEGQAVVTIAARPAAHEATCALDIVFCVQQNAVLPYGEISYTYGPGPWLNSTGNTYPGYEVDEISERVVSLGADAVTDSDGTVYSTAVAFTVTNAPEQGKYNADLLVFNHGHDGTTVNNVYYQPTGILDLEEGEIYTLSCWARLTAGTKAKLYMGYGHNSGGYANTGPAGNHRYIDFTGTTWTRVTWSFVFRSTASYQVQGAAPYTATVEHKKRVAVGVCRYADGTVQLCGFRLVHGGLYGSNTVDTLTAQVEDVYESAEQMQAFFTSIAPVESGATASTNYAAGALVMWKGKLYKTSAAVATGATWAVGTNLTATTLAAELAALAQ